MTRDYKKSSKPKEKPSPRIGLFVFTYLTGILSGVFLIFLAYLEFGVPSWLEQAKAVDAAPAQREAKTSGSPILSVKPPTFDFYEILPEEEIKIKKTPEDNARVAKGRPTSKYILQVASFRAAEDAERVKAELALIGLEATIEKRRVSSGTLWHRVKVGPYLTTRALDKDKRRLNEHGFDSLTVKLKSDS